MTMSYTHDFRITTYPARVYSGKDALGNLPAEVKRHRARRAFIVCGRSVSQKTDLIERIRRLLGDACAGVYDRMGKDTPMSDVMAARDQAREAGADLLIAVGAGSVVQGVRLVAIFLAEKGRPEELCTQYPEDGRAAISPKLMAPKLPIINILTAATTAQNRGGQPMKAEGYDHRLEYFDPKTRPVALFWDADALLTAPESMMRMSAAAIYWRAIMNMGYTEATPLVDFSRRQVWELVNRAIARLDDPNDAAPRIDLCIATFYINREVDDGGGRVRHWPARVVYAFATALFNLHEEIAQGAANAALTPSAMRHFGDREPEKMAGIARALGVWKDGEPLAEAPLRAAAEIERRMRGLGMPGRLSELNFPKASLRIVLENSMKNFNADPKREFLRERPQMEKALEGAW
jgi:alcohol dehydrogenase class IV